jgi:hypothetical protein
MKTLISVLITVLLLSTAAVGVDYPLIAGQNQTIGHVEVWNDTSILYVKFVTVAPWYMMETHVAVGDSLSDIPVTKKGNPIPGQFEYGSTHSPVLVRQYEIPLAGLGSSLFIAAHAATNLQSAMWVCSDGTETYTAMSGPGTATNPNPEYADPLNPPAPRSGEAVLTWNHPSWISNVNPQFTCGQWVWESYECVNPIYGDVVDFYKSFPVPGLPNGGTLWITADNGYKAYINGMPIVGASDGLSGDWRTSDLTESYVTTAMAAWSSVEIASFLASGMNTFHFETANEYMYPDDGSNPVGTVTNNPGGLIYEAYITYYEDGETAWGAGTEFVTDRGWATYFTYTVQ